MVQIGKGRALAIATVAATTVVLGAGTVPAGASGALQPHRAVYDLALADTSQAAGISGVRGRMVYEFTGGPCEGYSVSFRFVTQVADEGGNMRVTDLQTSSFEEPAGKAFQFVSKTFVNQKLSEETHGRAEHKSSAIELDLKKPAEEEVTLPGDALFPTEHLTRLIENASNGKPIFVADIFDGSESGQKIYETTAVIGLKREGPGAAEKDDPKAVETIGGHRHWPVTISYFDGSGDHTGERTPIYQLSFLLYENGISRRLLLDYGDFELRGNLVELTRIDATPCKD